MRRHRQSPPRWWGRRAGLYAEQVALDRAAQEHAAAKADHFDGAGPDTVPTPTEPKPETPTPSPN